MHNTSEKLLGTSQDRCVLMRGVAIAGIGEPADWEGFIVLSFDPESTGRCKGYVARAGDAHGFDEGDEVWTPRLDRLAALWQAGWEDLEAKRIEAERQAAEAAAQRDAKMAAEAAAMDESARQIAIATGAAADE